VRQRFGVWPALLVLLWLLLLPTLTSAQGGSVVVDELGQLNEGRIRQAIASLEQRGAVVGVYLVEQGSDADFEQRLLDDNLKRADGILRRGLVAIYVGVEEPRVAAIRYEDSWNAALAREVNGEPNVDLIRREVLAPALRDGFASGDFTAAYVDTLGAIEQAIISPPEENPVDTSPIGWAIGGAAALGVGAAVGVPAYRRRRAVQAALAKARGAYDEARRAAGAAIADTGQVLRRVDEKAAYDAVSYPDEVVRELAQLTNGARRDFAKAQEHFDELEESAQGRPTITREQYEQLAVGYGQVAQQVGVARQALEQSEAKRAELDALRRQADSDLQNAKKA
jgi:hypothetical protein